MWLLALVPIAIADAPQKPEDAVTSAPDGAAQTGVFELRAPTLDEPVAGSVFSLVLSFENTTDTTQKHVLDDSTTTVTVKSGEVERQVSVAWSLSEVEIPPGGLLAVFGGLVLPAGHHTVTVAHAPTKTVRSLELDLE
jgi:hypothetical protein